tara:strand:+ start:387 stop:587 length:201 start_codon:yes stop_codon:yes gene_type:complete
MKEIIQVAIQIIDRGITFPLQSTIEVHRPIEENVEKFLKENAHAMDLSSKFEFEITSEKSVGFGTI